MAADEDESLTEDVPGAAKDVLGAAEVADEHLEHRRSQRKRVPTEKALLLESTRKAHDEDGSNEDSDDERMTVSTLPATLREGSRTPVPKRGILKALGSQNIQGHANTSLPMTPEHAPASSSPSEAARLRRRSIKKPTTAVHVSQGQARNVQDGHALTVKSRRKLSKPKV